MVTCLKKLLVRSHKSQVAHWGQMSKSLRYQQHATSDVKHLFESATKCHLSNSLQLTKEIEMQKEIAVRFYENKKYGNTYGKGMFHKAVFNSTADIRQPKAKYLLDWFNYGDWENTAKSDMDMELLATAADIYTGKSTEGVLGTWVKRMDSDGSKPRVSGFGVLDLNTGEMTLLINDTAFGVEEAWLLPAKPCKQNGNSPQLLATNAEL